MLVVPLPYISVQAVNRSPLEIMRFYLLFVAFVGDIFRRVRHCFVVVIFSAIQRVEGNSFTLELIHCVVVAAVHRTNVLKCYPYDNLLNVSLVISYLVSICVTTVVQPVITVLKILKDGRILLTHAMKRYRQ